VPVTRGQRVEQRRMVTGVDGPQCSKAALAWAVHQAELTGAVVEAVTAEEWPATSGLDPQLHRDYPAAAARMLTDATAEVGGRATVRPRVNPGTRQRCWSRRRLGLSCWWWAAAATAGSWRRCWGRSACTASSTRTAQSW
jgi:hypothetical protein